MEIRWLGHSCFELTESTGTVVVTDPYNGYVGYEMPKTEADIVTVSHGHDDHNYLDGVVGDYVLVNKAELLEHKGVSIIGFNTFHDDVGGSKRGKNVVFKYRIDGMDVCHLGDIGECCNADLVSDLTPVDVLLIPIGGKYTIDAEMAKEYIDALMPDIVIPMHYKVKGCEFDIDKIDAFLKLFDDVDIEHIPSDTLHIDRDDISHGRIRIVVLERAK